jgi:hypothetical protein
LLQIVPIRKSKAQAAATSLLQASVTNDSGFIGQDSPAFEFKSHARINDISLDTKSSIPQFLNLKKSIQSPTVDEIKE